MREKLFTERFELNLTKEQRDNLRKRAKKNSQTMNEVVRELINSYC